MTLWPLWPTEYGRINVVLFLNPELKLAASTSCLLKDSFWNPEQPHKESGYPETILPERSAVGSPTDSLAILGKVWAHIGYHLD